VKLLQLVMFFICLNVAIGLVNTLATGTLVDVNGEPIVTGLSGQTYIEKYSSAGETMSSDAGTLLSGSDNTRDPSEEGWGSGSTKAGGLYSTIDSIAFGFPNLVGRAIPESAAKTWIVLGLKSLIGFSLGLLVLSLILRFNTNEL